MIIQIISEIENEDATAYMLSESSLFVFQNHVIIKTCGTTKCLQSLELMQKLAKARFSFYIFTKIWPFKYVLKTSEI